MREVTVKTVCAEDRVPVYKHEGDAGADMRADVPGPVTIMPGESAWVGTGVRLEVPEGHVGLQFPRSGLGCNHGICLANGVGVIDSGYRGEVRAKLLNLGAEPFVRLAFERVGGLGGTDRGKGGYGSTGVR